MLEVVIPGTRHGRGVINSSSAYRGMCCYIAGVNASGYQLLQLPYTSAQAAAAVYPVNKYYFPEDLNDTSDAVDKLTKGDPIVYFEGGEYITDKFNLGSFGLDSVYWDAIEGGLSSSYGKKMYSPGSSTAQGTTGLRKVWVSTGLGGQHKLYGDTSFARTEVTVEIEADWIGFAVGVYHEDSASAKLHWRVHPNRSNARSDFIL